MKAGKGSVAPGAPGGKNQSRAPPQSRPQTAGAGMPLARLDACPAAPGGRAPFCARAPLPDQAFLCVGAAGFAQPVMLSIWLKYILRFRNKRQFFCFTFFCFAGGKA